MKVYTNWAFDEDANMKCKENIQTYKELEAKYRVMHCYRSNLDKVNMEEYDIVIAFAESGYAHAKYIIEKNQPRIGFDELALLCDRGNLCFGYREGCMDYRDKIGSLIIHTD